MLANFQLRYNAIHRNKCRSNLSKSVLSIEAYIAVWLFDENIIKKIKNGQGQDQRVVS